MRRVADGLDIGRSGPPRRCNPSDRYTRQLARAFRQSIADCRQLDEWNMLVLSRQRDESIIIGDNVVVTIVDVRGDKVRLGIDAPREVPVHRREVYEAIQRENQQAARIRADDARRVPDGSCDTK